MDRRYGVPLPFEIKDTDPVGQNHNVTVHFEGMTILASLAKYAIDLLGEPVTPFTITIKGGDRGRDGKLLVTAINFHVFSSVKL